MVSQHGQKGLAGCRHATPVTAPRPRLVPRRDRSPCDRCGAIRHERRRVVRRRATAESLPVRCAFPVVPAPRRQGPTRLPRRCPGPGTTGRRCSRAHVGRRDWTGTRTRPIRRLPRSPADDQERTPEGGLGIVAQAIAHGGQGVIHLGRGRQRLRERGESFRFQRLAIAGDEGLDRLDRQRPELEARRGGRVQGHQMRCAPLVITLTV